jgi:flagellar hook-associated protein 3 FlgL
MRIGFNTKYQSFLADLNRLSSEINASQLKISSGKKFLRPSDDPPSAVITLNYKQGISVIERYGEAIDEGLAFLRAQESTLGQVEDLIARAKTLAINSVNATNDVNARQAIAKEIDSIVSTLLSLANSQLGEKYIFSGDKTTGFEEGTKPFMLIKETLPNGQVIERVVYNGSVEQASIGYDKDMKLTLGETGQKIFMETGVFETLLALKRTLQADNNIDYQKEQYYIQSFIGKLDEIFNAISGYRGEVGAKISHLETKRDLYEDFKQTIQKNLAEAESADLAELATKLQSLSIAYDAALKSVAMVADLSLAKYL